MTRVLLVSYSFPPLKGAEVTITTNYVQTLPTLGCSLMVLTGDPALKETDDDMIRSIPVGVLVVRATSIEDLVLRLLGRLGLADVRSVSELEVEMDDDSHQSTASVLSALRHAKPLPNHVVGWVPFATWKGKKLLRDVDCIISRSNPITSHLVALKLKSWSRLPWIACFSDPWTLDPDPPYSGRFFSPRFISTLSRRLERQIFRRADAVVLTTEEQRQMYSYEYPEFDSKIVVIPNSFPPDIQAQLVKLQDQITGPKSDEEAPYAILHAGNLFRRRSPEPVFVALVLLKNTQPDIYKNLRVTFLGEMSSFSTLVREYGLNDIVNVKPPVPRMEALRQCLAADLLLLIDAPSASRSVFLPSKVLDYIVIGKPILAITPEGACADIVRQTRTGLVIASYTAGDIAAGITDFYLKSRKGIERLDRNWHEIEKYSTETCAARLVQLVEQLRQSPGCEP